MSDDSVSVEEVVRRASSDQRMLHPTTPIDVRIDGDLHVTGSEELLARAVGNLIDNACVVQRRRAEASHSQPGAGLGLTLTRDIVAAADGRLALYSTQGAGTIATITLPERQPNRVRH